MKQDPYKTLEGFVNWMDERGYRSHTQRLYVDFVKKIYIHHNIYIDKEKFKESVSLPKQQIHEDEALTTEAARKIILECHHAALRALLTLIKDTLARPSELTSLRLEHLNLAHDPPYLHIPAYASKNDLPRECFFTNETKDFLITHLKKQNITQPNQYIFLNNKKPLDPIADEKGFQTAVTRKLTALRSTWKYLLNTNLTELRKKIERRGVMTRYTITPYSFKKYGFTKIADTLGALAAHAIAGHKAYLITYYKKTREERAEDYKKVAPKLQLLQREEDEEEKIKKELTNTINTLPKDRLAEILKIAKSLIKG
ncbi:MAG: tyrosine-type recombinase/integrase [Nitrososphaerales archaeon]